MARRRDGVTFLRALLSIGVLAFGCQGTEQSTPNVGSETHFLSWCAAGESCGEGLECLCGVCTAPCADAASCSGQASVAECLAVGTGVVDDSCTDTGVETACEVTCDGDDDCASLGSAHRCDRGFCRRLALDCQADPVAGSEVVIIGDRFLADSGEVVAELEALARSAGALPADERFADHSSSVITPFGGGSDLTTQYAAARDAGAARIVIMNVGGPDALLSCPEPLTETCPSLQNAVAGADALWAQMAQDGVEAVVNFFYPDPESETLRARFDVLRTLMQETCDASAVGCHFLDLRPTFEGHEQTYLMPGGLLPTAAGSVATAEAIWSLMQRRCIAQVP